MAKEQNKAENIVLQQFINARSKEIEAIEKSINNKKRATQTFQAVPHYKRRRNHSYEKRVHKYKQRTKMRFILRTHIYYAKRFRMMKLRDVGKLSIPWDRNVKSKSLIDKAYKIGWLVDEGFRSIKEIDACPIKLNELEFINIDGSDYLNINGVKYISTLDINQCDSKFNIFKVFDANTSEFGKIKNVVDKYGGKLLKNCDKTDKLTNYLIFCDNKHTMEILINCNKIYLRSISIKELEYVALKYDTMTDYDKINTELFKIIDKNIVDQITEKYNKTPKSKRVEINLNQLSLITDESITYFIFKLSQGSAKRSDHILNSDHVVGKVIRSGYKRSAGCNYGLGYLYNKNINQINNIKVQCIRSGNKHPIEIIKMFNQ